ncbi:MAG: aminotransferase class III-fold pyridoxal phosphate-dependent enzyme [Saccharofermentanales bacterium]
MIKTVKKSLKQIIGSEYMDSLIQGSVAMYGTDEKTAVKYATDEVDYFPESFALRMSNMLSQVGKSIIPAISGTAKGATTLAFKKAEKLDASPLCGLGYLRLGEDGRVYLTAKSEHYHTPLGHFFPGYNLIRNAQALGITNATHNNTRGYITRLLEMELVRTANGIEKSDTAGLEAVLCSKEAHVLNRVINLETGSLACEAGIKMMLSRFYKIDASYPDPKYHGKTPVFFVIADNEGGSTANYHGTTVVAQTFRNLWPDLRARIEEEGIYRICPVNINDIEDFRQKFSEYNSGKYKAAGFLHEIIMMNYGGIRLNQDYLASAYELCHQKDTPVMVDEIQSCMWYPGMFLFREYGLNPDFVIIGKGFSGGQYPASRIITTYEMDNLNLFGALVTNGQEELASLVYLITMDFAVENSGHIIEISDYYFSKLLMLQQLFPEFIEKIEGLGLLASICFYNIDDAVRFAQILNNDAIDISAQTYKPRCPSAVLTKIPIISTTGMIDFLIGKMQQGLEMLSTGSTD